MTLQEQQLWYFVLASVGLFEYIKSRRKSWVYLFCIFSAGAVFLKGVEGALLLILGAFSLLLQNLQAQGEQEEVRSRSQKVILGAISGLIFLSSSLNGDLIGLGCFILFVFLVTTDWPFSGALRSNHKEDLVETNSKILIYIPVSLLLANIFVPNQEWVSYAFFTLSFISFWGPNKDLPLFLIFTGLVWIKPELRIFSPAITVLCLGQGWSARALQLAVFYLVCTVELPLEEEVLMGVFGAAGLFAGWMSAERDWPKLNMKNKAAIRDYIFLAIAVLAIVLIALFVNNIEEIVWPRPEGFVFGVAAILMEVLKRFVSPLNKIKFNKAFRWSLLDVFSLMPCLKTQERVLGVANHEISSGFSVVKHKKELNLESRNFGIGLFAIILWSLVLWCYYNI